MKKILVPCDFSAAAENALQVALQLAEQSNGVIHLLHVIELPMIHDTILVPVLTFEANLVDDMSERVKGKMASILEKTNRQGIRVEKFVETGSVVKTVTSHARQQGCDVIVMGSHGASGLKEFIIGSNAEKVVRTSPAPVLIVKQKRTGPVKSIVFPNTLETGRQEDELVMKVKELQNFFGARLHLLWVNTPESFVADPVTIRKLRNFAARFMLPNCSINIYNHITTEQGILEFSKSVDADVIALATHGRQGLSHIISGSLAEDVVNHASTMIWTWSLRNAAVPV